MREAFSDRLKRLRTNRGLRQVDLARALGLGQTTIANYESGKRFPDEAVLNRLADLFQSSADQLLGRIDAAPGPAEAVGASAASLPKIAARYLQLLRSGQKQGAEALVLHAPQRRRGIRAVYAEILEPALFEAGRLWAAGNLSVAEEHSISQATMEVISRLSTGSGNAGSPGRTCCAFIPYGEKHLIGLRMIADVLEQDGWRVTFLGGNLPADLATDYVRDAQPDLLALSVTMTYNAGFARDVITSIRAQDAPHHPKILVGGQAFRLDSKLWRTVGADDTAAGMGDVCRVARRLVPRRVKQI